LRKTAARSRSRASQQTAIDYGQSITYDAGEALEADKVGTVGRRRLYRPRKQLDQVREEHMKRLARVAWRLGMNIALMTPGLRGANAAIPLLPICTWPVESTGQGILNVATQDTNTTYWFMPIDTSVWGSVVIRGTYPDARFFNFTSYD